MLTKFNTNTHNTTFIKSLVTSACLPIYDCIQDGDRIIEDCYYIYHGMLIKCLVGGILDKRLNHLAPGEAYVNRDNSRFICIQDIGFGKYYTNVTRKETCPNSYYDYDTHRLLGRYLRMLRGYFNIDLFDLYNCFDGTYLDDVSIGDVKKIDYTQTYSKIVKAEKDYYPLNLFSISSAKVLWVPIKFNTKYTIFLDSKKPVKMCPVFRNGGAGLIKVQVKANNTARSIFNAEHDGNLAKGIEPVGYRDVHYTWHDHTDYNVKKENGELVYTKISRPTYRGRFNPFVVNDMQFVRPYVWEGVYCDERDLYECQQYLGLIIQLDKNNTSSVVVFEGDKTKQVRTIFNSQNTAWLDREQYVPLDDQNYRLPSREKGVKYLIDELTPARFNEFFSSPHQLTLINDNNIYAFNDKLVDYLLHHVITNQEMITNNIGRIQDIIPNTHTYDDIWDDRIRVDVYNKFMRDFDVTRFDANGFIDSEVERFLEVNKDKLMV